MEDFNMNITSQNNSYDYSNITSNYSNITSNYSYITYEYPDYSIYEYYVKVWFIMTVVTYVIIGVGLLSTPIAIYGLCSQIRNDHVAPIYIINLLISDLIQLCCLTIWVAPTDMMISDISSSIYYSSVTVSVGFMVCIALERYLVIVHPLWYRCRRSIKSSVVVCVLVWVLALVFELIYYFSYYDYIIFNVFLLLPLPLFIFFLGGVLKALSVSISVPSDEKRRIVAVLVLVLLIYSLLFLPHIIYELSWMNSHGLDFTLFSMAVMFSRLSPLADLTLYVLMRKGTIDRLLSSVCCCRMGSDDTNSLSV